MYERSAIVLERYFENLLEYRREGNLRDNFNNYCDLVEKLEKYQINYQKELAATQEYNESIEDIKVIQASQEKLYKKSAKLEYNRYILFNNIDAKLEDTKKCIEKIESDVENNNEAMREMKEKFLEALAIYNEKRFELSKCKRYKKMAENAYNESLEEARTNYDGITQEVLNLARAFAKFDDVEDIIVEMQDNGKNEKIPFNEEVIENATKLGVEIAKREAAGYLVLYDKMTKLLSDIDEGATKIELHKKYARNEKAKMDFLFAVKNYIVQFLDYERMTVIHGRKSHNRLMSEACENFAADTTQINNLYELLVKEIANKATKKAYKELYNKSYLIDIQEKEEKFKKEKNRVNLNTATLINSNYWRIEGVTEIYTVYYKTLTETFGKTGIEFDLPKEESDDDSQEAYFEEDIKDENVEEVKPKVKEKAKIPFEITEDFTVADLDVDEEPEEDEEEEESTVLYAASKEKYVDDEEDEYNDDEDEDDDDYENEEVIESEDDEEEDDDEDEETVYSETYDDLIGNVVEEFQEGSDDEFDIFGEKYRNIDFSDTPNMKSRNRFDIFGEEEYMDEGEADEEESVIPYSFEDEDDAEKEEEDLFVDIKPVKRQRKGKNVIEDVDVTEESSSKVLLKKIRKINNVKKKKAEFDM